MDACPCQKGLWRRQEGVASAGSREEVGSLAFPLPFSGFPGRNFHGRPQTWVRRSEVSNRLETDGSHHGGEEGTPLGARAGLASAQRATGRYRALLMPLLPKRERGMFAHRGPKSARVEKKHMGSITASTCGLEKSALSPHHPLLPTISEFLFFRSKNME